MPVRLRESYINGLRPRPRAYAVRDAAVTGLMVVVNAQSKSYAVQRDLWRGTRGRRHLVKTVRHHIGRVDEMSLDDARTAAQEVVAKIKRGIDPGAPEGTPRDAETWTVGQLWAHYADDLATREAAERTVADFREVLDDHLPDWRGLPLNELRRSMCRERHRELSQRTGKVVANRALQSLRAAYNFALRAVDDPDALPDNPVTAVTFNKERRREAVIMPDDLPDWWRRVQGLPNPLRVEMHTLGLLSGLRPSNLVGLQREWLRLGDSAITIPAASMKSRRQFDLPLSERMLACVRRAITIGDALHPGTPWLFPTRNRAGDRMQTQVWKERVLPSETGHILRHTYRTLAHAAGVSQIDTQLLMDHKVPGVTGRYLHDRALFNHLCDCQEKVSAYILSLLTPVERRPQARRAKTDCIVAPLVSS
jgi:integrase